MQPYTPYLPTSTPVPVHHATITPTNLPQVNDAFSKVERDLNCLNDTLSHPHTINNPTSYQRAVNITSKIEELTSAVGSLRQKMKSYEKNSHNSPDNRRYKVSPSSLKHLTKNVMYNSSIVSPTFRQPYVKPENPYLKKKKLGLTSPKK